MASRRSHAPSHSRTSISSRVPRGHVSVRNPLQAPKERSCGISITLSPSWFRKAGPTIILNIIRDVLVPLRGTIWGGSIARTHSGAPSELAVGFMILVPLRGTRSSYSISLCSWVQPPVAECSISLCLWVRGYGETP